MFDLHSHILPGLDDGPESIEESVDIVRMAAEDGATAILATPHSKDVQEASAHDEVCRKIKVLKRKAREQGIDIEIFLGMENHLTADLIDLVDQGEGYPINGHNYILVELPFVLYPDYADDVLFQLQLKGYTPLIAHPERQEAIQNNPLIMEKLVARGVLGQVTAASILGRFGPSAAKSARTLIERNLVHVVASDAHHSGGPRAPGMKEAVDMVGRIVGPERAQAMSVAVPGAILEGRLVKIATPLGPTNSHRWRFWQR